MWPIAPINIPPNSGIKDWEILSRQAGALAEQVYDMLTRADRLYAANSLANLIETGKPGQSNKFIGDSSLTYEGAKAMAEFSKAYHTFMTTPINVPMAPAAFVEGEVVEPAATPAPVPITPLQIVSVRAGIPLPGPIAAIETTIVDAPADAVPQLGPPVVPPDTVEGTTP